MDRVREGSGDDGGLPLNARGNRGLVQGDGEVFAFVVGRDDEGDVEVADRLVPFVGEGCLLGLLAGAGGCFLCWGGF